MDGPQRGTEYEMARGVLRDVWGYSNFREGQEEAIRAVLEERDALVILPTGGGKSLCYQIPGIVRNGFTLVISPLIALMQDQVEGLERRGISAAFINSTLSKREIDQRWTNAEHGQYDLLYVAPERLETSMFEARADRLPVNLVAVDEAHCVSEWGHHFRPAYLEIKTARHHLGDPPMIAVTATATPEVRRDIVEQLQLRRPARVVQGFDRSNLTWAVLSDENKRSKLIEIASGVSGSGLVYVATRKSAEGWADWLKQQDISAESYHGGMPSVTRKLVQERWLSGEVRIVVATNAFGMGIDKPDVRFVVHVELPGSVEAYYQEAGRGGRDGGRAYAVMLYQNLDVETQEYLIDSAHPSRKEVQSVYAAVCNLAQVPLHAQPEDPLHVQIDQIGQLTGCGAGKVKTAVDLLEREGYWTLLPTRSNLAYLRFRRPADEVRRYADGQSNRAVGEFVRELLRAVHADAFAQWWPLELDRLERRTGLERNRLESGLDFLSARGILKWMAPSDALRIELLKPRAEKPPIQDRTVQRARRRAEKRLQYLKRYAQSVTCRRAFLLNYFGESHPGQCGRCDVCMGRHDTVAITANDEPQLRRILLAIREESIRSAWSVDVPSHRLDRYLDWLIQHEYVHPLEGLEMAYALSEKGHRMLAEWKPASQAGG